MNEKDPRKENDKGERELNWVMNEKLNKWINQKVKVINGKWEKNEKKKLKYNSWMNK